MIEDLPQDDLQTTARLLLETTCKPLSPSNLMGAIALLLRMIYSQAVLKDEDGKVIECARYDFSRPNDYYIGVFGDADLQNTERVPGITVTLQGANTNSILLGEGGTMYDETTRENQQMMSLSGDIDVIHDEFHASLALRRAEYTAFTILALQKVLSYQWNLESFKLKGFFPASLAKTRPASYYSAVTRFNFEMMASMRSVEESLPLEKIMLQIDRESDKLNL